MTSCLCVCVCVIRARSELLILCGYIGALLAIRRKYSSIVSALYEYTRCVPPSKHNMNYNRITIEEFLITYLFPIIPWSFLIGQLVCVKTV